MPEQDTVIRPAFQLKMANDSCVPVSFNLSETPDSFTVLRGSMRGETGSPLPYSLYADNPLTISLLACSCLYIVLIGRFAGSLVRQLRAFLFSTNTSEGSSSTSTDTRVLIVLSIMNCAMLSFATYLYVSKNNLYFSTDSPFLFVMTLTGLYFAFFLVKWSLYTLVNLVFFGKKKNLQWIKNLIFLSASEGVLLFPVVTLQFYFDFSIVFLTVFSVFVLVLNEILTFYKCWQNFFQQNGGFLQTFLYFCALEIIPTLAFGGVLLVSADAFGIKF